jgi:hypothetical protein
MENKNECNIYLWCSEKKRDKIIKYIYDKMDGYIRNKVIINDVNNNTMCKYEIDDISGNNCIDMDIYQKLLKYTTIDREFLETFFKKFKTGDKIEFNMKDDNVAQYLGVKLSTLRKRLCNAFSKNDNFMEKVDYIRIRNGKYITYMINYQCFERLAMTGDSDQSETVRMYFVKLREFIVENQHLIYQAMENKSDLSLYANKDTMYFFVVDDRHPNMLKSGRTKDIVKRLRNYNVGRIKEVELKYFAMVKNPLLIENCIKFKLEKNRVFKNKEIFYIDPAKLKKAINDCYCKHVNKNQNEEMYKEISDLLGMYIYVKDKVHIKPYVIIGKDI